MIDDWDAFPQFNAAAFNERQRKCHDLKCAIVASYFPTAAEVSLPTSNAKGVPDVGERGKDNSDSAATLIARGAGIVAALASLSGCDTLTPTIHTYYTTAEVTNVCRFHRVSNGAMNNAGGFAGCMYWDYNGCNIAVVTIPKIFTKLVKHETRHCTEGAFHPPGYGLSDLEREE